MLELFINKYTKTKQFFISLLLTILVAGFCFAFSRYINYKIVAFILLLLVSLIAMSFDILPVLCTAIFTAIIWDFFFIPPHFTLQVGSSEDAILLSMYLVIALVNAVLTYKIRQIEKIVLQKEEKSKSLKLYNTILNSLSHELRTPIAAIIGATDNMQNLNGKLTDIHKQELISEISKASFRLNQQVENLLNMSRLESGFIKPKNDWCDITETVYTVIQRIEENNIPQKISININPAIPFYKLDRGMLEQVIYNLVNNAVRHIPPESTINIVALSHADILKIIIEDNGPGFPENEIPKVFEKFYRLDRSKTGGTGLGLSLVKGFTEAMGGNVYLFNNHEGGATFTVEIKADTSHSINLSNG